MKTEDPAQAGKHAFEIAGLGQAPFRFVGMSENVIAYPDGTQKAGGSCDYCGTGIRYECQIASKDGKRAKVGCECIRKVGDAGLLQAYKTSPEFRAHQRQLRALKAKAILTELSALIAANAGLLATLPHPYGYTDRQTGKALTRLDSVNWLLSHSGDSGRASLLRGLRKTLAELKTAEPTNELADNSDRVSLPYAEREERAELPAMDTQADLTEPERD